ncbi:MAG: hypothetical protein RIF41_32770, partial [Polyangiaceae bacterium]
GGAGAGGAGATGGTSATAPSCEGYCATVTAACTGDAAVYTSEQSCAAVCAELELGTAGSSDGNTVACRQAQAAAAGDDASLCPAAGPGGDGTCGSTCEGYCSLFEALCPTEFAASYTSTPACEASCATDIPDLGGFDVTVVEGDSIQCRLYHVTQAALDAAFHCAHAAGLEICVE